MAKLSKIGINGEQIAVDFLLNKGYIILFRNWRSGQKEIDIIAQHGEVVVFVEVKTRSGSRLQYPEEAVNKRKQSYLKAAAAVYANEQTDNRPIRFDIIGIVMETSHAKEIVHFEEAFH